MPAAQGILDLCDCLVACFLLVLPDEFLLQVVFISIFKRPVGLRIWIQQQLSGLSPLPRSAQVDLVEPLGGTVPVPHRVGLDYFQPAKPWSIARLARLFHDAAHQPSESTFQAARVARHCLSAFWMSAPVDHLQQLYEGELGSLQQLLLEGPLVKQGLALDEQSWASKLQSLLNDRPQHSRQLNILLALLPYTQPGQLSLPKPLETLPDWLLPDYINYAEPQLAAKRDQPAGLLNPSPETFDPLTTRRGEDAMAWFRDDDVLQQITSLIEAYQQDSSSQDVVEELAGVRVVLAQLWLDVEPNQLQTLLHTPAGKITQAMIKAGFGRSLVDQQDQLARDQLVARARDFSQPDVPAVILAMLMFYPPERVSFKSTDGLPKWFVDVLSEL